MWYILHKMNQVKPDVIYARRKERQAKLLAQSLYPQTSNPFSSSNTDGYHYHSDDSPTARYRSPSSVTLHAPQPQPVVTPIPAHFSKDEEQG